MNFRNISAWSIRNPVIPLVAFTALLLAGILSFVRMDVVNNPDIEFPAVNVTISQPGAAPTEIENQITQQVEAAVRSVNGVNKITSTAREGSSNTFVEFEIGTDPNNAVAEVKNAIDRVRGSLPDGILEPRVEKVEIAGGFLGIYAVEANDMTIEQLSWFIDDTVAKQLLSIDGMAEAGRFAGVNREIEVILDLPKMQAYGVTASEINSVLRRDNLDAAGGMAEVGGTRQSVRVLGNTGTAFELSNRQIRLSNGTTLKLGDVATVRDGYSERTSISKVRDQEVVNFYMSRAKGASDVTVFEAAQKKIAEIEAANPDVKFIQLFDTVKYTKDQYSSSIAAMIEGAILAVVVVFFFLRDWRATFISAVAIPLSAIPTFWFMDLLGFNLNQMSLLALALVAGVLVDDAIVEIENIVRHMRMGKTAYQASIDAADEIGLPVVATSFCIVAVFLPVGLMPGVTGQFFKNFGLTVVVAVLMSLAVARMITPMLAAYFLQAKGHASHGEGKWMDRYMSVLHWSLERGKMHKRRDGVTPPKRRWAYALSLLFTTLILLAVSAVGVFMSFNALEGLQIPQTLANAAAEEETFLHSLIMRPLQLVQLGVATAVGFAIALGVLKGLGFVLRFLGQRLSQSWRYLEARFYDHRVWMLGVGWFAFMLTILLFGQTPFQFNPEVDDSTTQVRIEMVPGTTLEDTERVADRVAALLYEQQEVERVLERVSEGSATLYITLSEDRERPSYVFTRDLAPTLSSIPDARVRWNNMNGPGGGGSGRDLSIMLAGSDPVLLNDTAAQLVEEMKDLDMIVAPRITADVPRPEILIRPRPELMADLGVSTAAVGQAIRIATMGEIEQNAAKFSLSDRQIPITVRLPEEAREDITTIQNLPVPTANGTSVPLGRIADISFGAGPTTIQRYNQNRRVLIGADLASGVLRGNAMERVNALPTLTNLPQGVIRDQVGEDELQQELLDNFGIALLAGILLVFAVLVLLYKRLMSPLVNMTSLALAPLGGIFLVWIVGQPLSFPVLIGVLLLLGIVSKNSILLIDFAIEEMDKGTRKIDAIIDAGHKRAQPIVMTTVAMTAGMVPTALSLSGDGAWRAPMGTVVIGGLILSTLLTLLIVPAGFSLADGFEKRAGPWLRNKFLTYRPGDEDKLAGSKGNQPGIEPAE
ncbi:efflux RND transporter permease subunit [Qipengyuania gelatinilytica]|uniref:Efflux RND transporter permease subunit n=1 Tax=Qipengyuania gelatinilytica TaxID=2867231 RepID=A0ABX8ZYX8_9SPHN|nr:efflux RND transporter permease subunit [Qipengyuania gelatinilytica]QZD94221.1 efflux RND transporter permease subunit [Qipengyuania gelatinilytica]